MSKDSSNLPDSWISTDVAKICHKIHYGFTDTAKSNGPGVRYLRITDIQNGRVDWPKVPKCSLGKKEAEQHLLKTGDILFARTGGTVGKSFLLRSDPPDSVFASYLIRLIPSREIFPAFIYTFFQSANYWAQIELSKTGLKTNVNAAILGALEIPLPPLNEQKRIVEKIEELFSELDAGEASLRLARHQLSLYRQSLLKQAFEGKLTAPWREQNPHLLESPQALLTSIQQEREARYQSQLEEWNEERDESPKLVKPRKAKPLAKLSKDEVTELPRLPEQWCWEKNENYVSEVKDGTHYTPKYVGSGIPFITQKHIKNDAILFQDFKMISVEDHEKFSERSNVQDGDLLIAMIGHNRGNCCLVKTSRSFSIKNLGLFKFFNGAQSNQFLKYYYQSTTGLNLVLKKSKGGAQPFIGLTELRHWPVPVCSLPEQQEIVRLLEAQFEVITQNEREIDAALKRSQALRQSILKKAFSGRLVPQDPTDEPATTLLARIQAQRAAATPKKSPKKKSARKKTKS